jgi:glutamate-1-semialdehyde 2,1-aminomutase
MLLCNSGTEATMQGIRIMRAYTGKTKIAKFEGGYHGWHDYALWSYIIKPEKMGPLDAPALVPNSAGIPDEIKQTMLLLPNSEAAFGLIEEHASELAGVMIEPVNGVGTLPTDPAFLKGLREVTKRTGVPLMFDEVVTGFRFALGGAQEYYGVVADLATYGKAIGGGFPIGAVGCSREMMERVVHSDFPISVAGTFSGNPMSLAAGNATLDFLIQNPQVYDEMAAKGESLRSSFNEFARRKGLPGTMTGVASLSQVHLREPPINNLRDLLEQDFDALRDFQLHLRYNGVFTPGFHWACLSAVHSEQDIERAVEAHQVALEGCLSKS